jgi:hypothetical protein
MISFGIDSFNSNLIIGKMANLIELLNKRNFLPTKLPTRVPAEKVNEIIEVINALFPDGSNFSVEQILCSGDTNVMFEGAPMTLGFRPADYTFFFEDFIDTYGCIDLALANESESMAQAVTDVLVSKAPSKTAQLIYNAVKEKLK